MRLARWLLWGCCCLALAGCAARASRAGVAPSSYANPPPSTTSAAPRTQAVGPESPVSMIVQPGVLSVDEQRSLEGWSTDLAAHGEQLAAALAAGGVPDCPRAREHLQAVCELAERICRIAERHPSDSDLAGRCADARDRCASRTEEIERRCGAS